MSAALGTGPPAARTPFTLAVGLAAVVFSALYFASDVLELAQGGFSTTQLVLTYVGEAAIPLFVIGLCAVQRPHIGRLGLLGAVGYAYTFVSSPARCCSRSSTPHRTGTPWWATSVPGSPCTGSSCS
jgi:hypothetical protein